MLVIEDVIIGDKKRSARGDRPLLPPTPAVRYRRRDGLNWVDCDLANSTSDGYDALETGGSPGCGGRSLDAPLAPAAGNSVLRFRLDWPAIVSQVAPYFFAYRTT